MFKSVVASAIFLAFLSGLPARASAQGCQLASESTKTEIQSILEEHAAAHLAQDADGAGAMYAESFWLGDASGPRTFSQAQYVETYRDIYRAWQDSGVRRTAMSYMTRETTICGPTLFQDGTYQYTLESADGDSTFAWRYSVLWMKDSAGGWRMQGGTLTPLVG